MSLLSSTLRRAQSTGGYILRPSGASIYEPTRTNVAAGLDHLRALSSTTPLEKNKYRLQPLFLPPDENAAGLRQRKGRKPKPYKAKDEMKYRNDPRWASAFHEDERSSWDSEEARARPRLKGMNGGKSWAAPAKMSNRERSFMGPPKWAKQGPSGGTSDRNFGLGPDEQWREGYDDPDFAPDAVDEPLVERPFFKSNYEPGSLERMPVERAVSKARRESSLAFRSDRHDDGEEPRRTDAFARRFTSPWSSAIREEKQRAGDGSMETFSGRAARLDGPSRLRQRDTSEGAERRMTNAFASKHRREGNSLNPHTPTTGWSPKKKLSIPAMAGLKRLHAEDPEKFSVDVLSEKFGISHEAVKRVIGSKFREKEKAGDREDEAEL